VTEHEIVHIRSFVAPVTTQEVKHHFSIGDQTDHCGQAQMKKSVEQWIMKQLHHIESRSGEMVGEGSHGDV